MTLALVSLAIALVALLVNVAGLVRRPRIVAEWGYVVEQPPEEGLSVIVTARRRAIEVDEIGLVMLERIPLLHRSPEWLHAEFPARLVISPYGGLLDRSALPKRLEDGQSLRAYINLDQAQEHMPSAGGKAVPYVKASGTVYLAASKPDMLRWLRQHAHRDPTRA